MSEWSWEAMIAAFVALGGVARNVRPGCGARGQGLFCIDPASPASVQVPPNLLVADDQLVLEDGIARLLPGAEVDDAERDFYERYYNAFSWRREEDGSAFFAALEALAPEIRDVITDDLHFGGLLARARTFPAFDEFKKSRSIRIAERKVMMPIVELVNHASHAPGFNTMQGVAVRGRFAGEVLVRYARTDAFGILASWGFASPEPRAYGLQMQFSWQGRAVAVHRAFRAASQGSRLPTVTASDKTIAISYILLGNVEYPQMPRQLFVAAMAEAGQNDAGLLFDKIRQRNHAKLERLTAALQGRVGAGEALLSKTCAYQLQALAGCEA